MPERSTVPRGEPIPIGAPSDQPPSEVADFIRFCHHRRPSGWPEIYDEMCAVAARREFKGWSHDDFASRGLTFALPEMLRLSSWVRAVLASQAASFEGSPPALAIR